MENKKIEYWDEERTKIKKEEWFNSKGNYSRVDGPAYQSWFENGQKRYESWCLYGKNHRVDGPAIQGWYNNGQKQFESWWLHDKRHRVDGPARQEWFENEQKNYEEWYLDGKELSEREIMVLKRKRKLLSLK